MAKLLTIQVVNYPACLPSTLVQNIYLRSLNKNWDAPIEENWTEGVELLLNKGASVYAYLDWEPTPLGFAVTNSSLEIVKLLIQAGANPNKGGVDYLPVHDAASLGKTEILKFLIQSGVEINGRNHAGQTPLMIAVCTRNLPIVKILIESGACINLVDYESGETALDIANEHNYPEIVEYILSVLKG